jgi:hypothetical protein
MTSFKQTTIEEPKPRTKQTGANAAMQELLNGWPGTIAGRVTGSLSTNQGGNMAKKTGVIDELVMVKLNVDFDSGYRGCREMQDLIIEKKKANRNALRTGVMLFPKTMTTPFTTAVSRLRRHVLDNSLPWDRNNWRVVPVSAWQDFKDELEKLIREAKTAFDDVFCKGYDDLKKAAEAFIGEIDVEFPTKEFIMERFSVEYKMGQAASPEDIRIQGIDQVERKKISESMKKQYEDQVNDGLNELAKRLVNATEDICERVQDGDQKGKKYTKAMENLRGLAETAEKLNVTGNDQIIAACKTIREDIAKWTPETIKENPLARDHIADSASSIRERLAGLKI